MSNGYKPSPLDLSDVKLSAAQELLVDKLSENAHNVWAKDRLKQGWTYGIQQVREHAGIRSVCLVIKTNGPLIPQLSGSSNRNAGSLRCVRSEPITASLSAGCEEQEKPSSGSVRVTRRAHQEVKPRQPSGSHSHADRIRIRRGAARPGRRWDPQHSTHDG